MKGDHMKEVIISVNKQGKLDVKVSGGMKYEEALHMCLNGLYSISNSFIKAARLDTKGTKNLRGQVYDSLNLAFTNFLNKFDPTAADPQFDEAVLQIAQKTARDLMQKSVDTGTPFKDLVDNYDKTGKLS